ncbi:MAG: 50S ribosomal protein L22 [Nitrospinota bacterium]
MEARAVQRYVRSSPFKVRLSVDLIRGKSVAEALSILALSPKRASKIVEKALRSAVANAREQGRSEDVERLVVRRAFVDGGPTLTRWRARARGRVARIRHRTCHVTVVVAEP